MAKSERGLARDLLATIRTLWDAYVYPSSVWYQLKKPRGR